MINKQEKLKRLISFLLAILFLFPFIPIKGVRANEFTGEPPLEANGLSWSSPTKIESVYTWDPKERWDGSHRPGVFYGRKGATTTSMAWITDNKGNSYFCIEPGVSLSTKHTYYRAGEYDGKMAEEIKLAFAFMHNMKYVDGEWLPKDEPSFKSQLQLNSLIWDMLGRTETKTQWLKNNVIDKVYDKIKQQINGTYEHPEHFAGDVKIYRYETKDRKAQTILGYSFKPAEEEEDVVIKSALSLKKESSTPELIQGNQNYTLDGAEYGIYESQNNAISDNDRLGTFVSDSNGNTNSIELSQGVYYIKEIKAPKGYELDTEIYEIDLKEPNQTFIVKDKPKTDPLSLMLKKTDNNGVGLAGAEFEVKYYQEIVSDVAGLTPTYTWVFKTNEEGILSFDEKYRTLGDNIPKDEVGNPAGTIGTYTIQETKAPKGYVLDDSLHIRQLKEESAISNALLFNAPSQKNESQKMRFTLQKEDLVNKAAHTEGSLEKAIYDVIVVESANKDLKAGDLVKTVETDKDGKILIDELELGTYDIVEKTPSKGYSLNPVAVRVKGQGDDSGAVYTSNVVQIKTNGKALVDLLNEKIEDLNTLNRINANGEEYRIFDKLSERQVNLEKKDNPKVYTNELAEYGRISLTKHADGEKGEEEATQSGKRRSEANIIFDVFNSKNEKVDSFTTDIFGRATSKYLEQGRYRVSQVTKAPGLINVEDFYVDIEGGFKEYQYNLENYQNLKYLQIVKIDEETGKEILQKDVSFKLLDENKKEIHQEINYPESEILTEFKTSEKGIVQLPNKIKPGIYYIREIKAPEGYYLDPNGEDIKVEIKDDNTKVIIQQVKNTPQKGGLILEKKANILKTTREENGITKLVFEEAYLSDTKWYLIANEDIMSFDGQTKIHSKGDLVQEIITNGKNNVVIEDLALGKYILKEVKVNSKYVLDTKEYEIEFTPQESSIKVDSKTERKFNERKTIEFEIVKEFEDSKHFTFNPKAEFGLFLKEDYTENGVTIKKDTLLQKMTLESQDIKEDKNSVSRTVTGSFKNIEIDGSFYVKELNVDDNYILDETNHDLSFDFSGTNTKNQNKVSTKIENKLKKVALSILKVEMGTIGEDQIPVAGAKYRLVAVDEAKGETTVGEYITDQDGRFEVKNLARGRYYLVEIQSPRGYFLNDERIDFDLRHKDHGEVIEARTENEKIPEIKTSAKDNKTANKEIDPTNKVEIVDNVKYKDLIVGKEYDLVGHLMDKETNKAIFDKDGKMVKSSLKFTPESRDGEVNLLFEIDASLLRGKEIVVFETLYREGRQVAIHHDINDQAQTVKITDPKGKTFAEWENKTKEVEEGQIYKLIDTFRYEDLIVGKEYKLIAYVVFRENGEILSEKKDLTFTPESKNGSIKVEFEIDTSKLGGKELVVFEELYDLEGNLLVDHKDINDDDQTVKVNNKPALEVDREIEKDNPKTGDFKIIANINAIVLAIAFMFLFDKKLFRASNIKNRTYIK